MTIARYWAVSYGWRGPAAHGGRCPRSTASSPPPTGDGGHGRSGVCGSASFRRWDGKRYPDQRPNSASDAVGIVFGTSEICASRGRVAQRNCLKSFGRPYNVALRDTEMVLFVPFWPSYTGQVCRRSVASTPFRTVSSGQLGE